jgi:hypothetical protein
VQRGLFSSRPKIKGVGSRQLGIRFASHA